MLTLVTKNIDLPKGLERFLPASVIWYLWSLAGPALCPAPGTVDISLLIS